MFGEVNNSMLNIFIYEGNAPVNKNLLKNLTIIESLHEGTFIINSFRSKSQLFYSLNSGTPISVLFFNDLINMDQINEIIMYIRKKLCNQNVLFVFPLMYAFSLAQELHEIGPITFIEDCAKLEHIETLLFQWEQQCESLYFIYKNKRKFILALYSDILYFEGEKRNIHLIMKYRREIFTGKLNDLYAKIGKDTHFFVRTHQSYIINMCNIKSVSSHVITMINNFNVPISNNCFDAVNNAISHLNEFKISEIGGEQHF